MTKAAETVGRRDNGNDPRAGLRSAVKRMEEEIARAAYSPALNEAWTELVGVLALDPAPEVRDCPSCGSVCMRAATRCGYCWIALPLANASRDSG